MNTKRYVGPVLVAVAIVALLAIAGVNVTAVLPFGLILLVCPIMMFFMMRGMNHRGGDQPRRANPADSGIDHADSERSTHGS